MENLGQLAAAPLASSDAVAATRAQATLALTGAVIALAEQMQQSTGGQAAPAAPSGFVIGTVMGDAESLLAECVRPGCRWATTHPTGVNLTELAAAANEHKQEAHDA